MIDSKAKTLPDQPSNLIRLAVNDLGLVEQDAKYCVDMRNAWHCPTFYDNADNFDEHDVEVCNVCFAGSIMVKSLGYYPSYTVNVETESTENNLKFSFLNFIRMYEIDEDYMFYLEQKGLLTNFPFTNDSLRVRVQKIESVKYEEDPDIFKTNMLKIADLFEEEGL